MLYVYNIYIYVYTHIHTVDSKSKHVKVERYRSHTGRIIILDKRRITPSCASFRSVSFSRDKRVVVLSLEKKKKKKKRGRSSFVPPNNNKEISNDKDRRERVPSSFLPSLLSTKKVGRVGRGRKWKSLARENWRRI